MKKSTDNLMHSLKADNCSLDSYLERSSSSFINPDIKQFWFSLLDKTDYSKSDIINKSEFNYRYFYDVINGRKIPTSDKVIRLSLAMKIGIDQCQHALQLSGKAQLYPKIRRDSIILYALKNNWPVVKCNNTLIKYGEEPLK